MKLLEDLLERITHQILQSGPSVSISKITDDSRQVEPGTLFIAVRGVSSDGHNYINAAVEAGATAIVGEAFSGNLAPGVAYIQVNDSAEAMGQIASAYYDHPSEAMEVVGVTGTNGKTTIATLLYRLHQMAGIPCGLISTVCNYINGEAIPSTHTTPSALPLQALLSRMHSAGCRYVFMEVSSHAVAQRRIAGLHFRGGVFTNLTRDHLDYHKTVQHYLNAKKRFFDELPGNAFALTNIDDKNGQVMLQNTPAQRYGYALHSLTDFSAKIIEQHIDSTDMRIGNKEVIVRLVGKFNAYNLLAVYATTRLLGMDEDQALQLLSQMEPVDGRFQTFTSAKRGYTAIVDYAHTPDALVNVLETIGSLKKAEHQIITVVGCGGDRDKGKRPLMAQEAVRLSDKVILTSDNPRTEVPETIIADMKEGISPNDNHRVLSIVDRAEAIRTACMLAQPGDIILVAGKGHETYQEIHGIRHPFDDRLIIQEQL